MENESKLIAFQCLVSSAALVAALVVATVAPSGAAAEEANIWTEADVLDRSRKADAELRIAEAQSNAAVAIAKRAHPHPNPAIGFEHEAFRGMSASRETKILLRIPIEIQGARELQRSLAKAEADGVVADVAGARSEAAAWALDRFYAIIAEAERLRVLDGSMSAVQEAARILEERQQAGASSGYEQARMAVELEILRSRLEQAKRSLEAGRRDLVDALHPDLKAVPEMRATLETNAPMTVEEALAAARGKHPELAAAREAEASASKARQQSKGLLVPRLEATGGLRLGNDGAGSLVLGYTFGASLEVALGGDRKALGAQAEGQLAIASARREAIDRALQRRVRHAHARLLAARAEHERLQKATAAASETILKSAQAAYREGELSLVQLLDAHRAHAEIALRSIELLEEAKRAEVELRRATGAL